VRAHVADAASVGCHSRGKRYGARSILDAFRSVSGYNARIHRGVKVTNCKHWRKPGRASINLSIANIKNRLADALNRVAYAGERVVLERRGKPVAVLVSVEDLELLEQIENEEDLRAARKARKEGGKPVPLAALKARLRRKKM
jgi:prevent-host-death family protein